MQAAAAPRALHEAYDAQAALAPGSLAAVCRGPPERRALSYAAVCKRSLDLAVGLRSLVSGREGGGAAGASTTVAVWLPRTHGDFLPLLLALSRAGLPFVLLSADLPDKKLEADRNDFTVRALRPWLCIVPAGSAPAAGSRWGERSPRVVAIDELTATTGPTPEPFPRLGQPAGLLAFLFTGGTQRTKIVQVSHDMVLHERRAYHDLWKPGAAGAVVLAHTSVYWGATALGQLSIALAFGGTAVLTQATEVADLLRCIQEEGVTVLGLVPDHLDLLAPLQPDRELPTVECVFTWGERLPQRIAGRWRRHPRGAIVRELLIATEYWLSLYADPLEGGSSGELRAVRGAELLVLTDEGQEAQVGEVGELCIAGPMVTPGYVAAEGAPEPPEAFCGHRGRRYYRTRDLVRRTRGGVVYKGRADMMAKDRGKWVDMLAVEDKLLQHDGVRGAKVVPDPLHEQFHAFVALAGDRRPGPLLSAARGGLPPQVRLWAVPELPRHPVTRKVDSNRLLRALPKPASPWPIEAADAAARASATLAARERFGDKLRRHYSWTLAALGTVVAVADAGDLGPQLSLAAAWICCLAVSTQQHLEESARSRFAFGVTATWVTAACSLRPSSLKLVRSLRSGVVLTYAWLAFIYAYDERNKAARDPERPIAITGRLGLAISALADFIPLLKLGTFAVLSCGSHCLPGPLSWACHLFLSGLAAFGAATAAYRGRFLSWPVAFWATGVGNQLEVECRAWTRLATWRWEASRLLGLPKLPLTLLRLLAEHLPSRPRAPAAAPAEPQPSRWPAAAQPAAAEAAAELPNDCRRCALQPTTYRGLCRGCLIGAVAEEERQALDWLEAELASTSASATSAREEATAGAAKTDGPPGGAPEPEAKRRRTDAEGGGGGPGGAGARATAERNGSAPGPRGGASDDEEISKRFRRFECWWWYNHVEDYFDVDRWELRKISEALDEASALPNSANAAAAAAEEELASPEVQLLCGLVSEVVPQLRPVRSGTALSGLDSLAAARLAYAVKARLGRAASVGQLREAGTVAGLAAVLEGMKDERSSEEVPVSDREREYAIWFSPGQYAPMGCWVLRSDEPADFAALGRAVARLVERHSSMRATLADPLFYMSLMYDAATLWSLYGPVLDHVGLPLARSLRRLVSWSMTKTWPRVRCLSREEVYGEQWPETAVPLDVVRICEGQDAFERELKRRSRGLKLPFTITVYEVVCHLVDVWTVDIPNYSGRFAIVRRPTDAKGADAELAYVDLKSKEWGPLLGPRSARWQPPPYRFPALYSVPLNTGGVVWIRLERTDELRVCYKANTRPGAYCHHFPAFRAARCRGREAGGEPVVVRYMGIAMLHAFADGNCYMPLAQDLMAYYESERGKAGAMTPPPFTGPQAFEALERRLMDVLECRPTPMRSSLRGSIFRFEGNGYGHSFGFHAGAVEALSLAAANYKVPLDVLLLGLVVCSLARADHTESIDFTLYTPMRDGAAEAMMIGLFADWRDLTVSADYQLATVLGTMLQLFHTVQHRHWRPFNALLKPDCIIVNVQPLDMERRSHWQHLGENLWHGGDQYESKPTRPKDTDWARQQLTVNIEQQDETMWWILIDAGVECRPPPWMRRFIYCMREAWQCLFYEPLAPVHRPLPDTEMASMAKW